MEYEVSFFDFDYKKIISLIKKKGKKIHSFFPFQITYFYLAGETNFKKGFVRVRDEYPGKCTITTKIFSEKYPKEYETQVTANYKDTVNILEQGGLKVGITSVKLREKWKFGKCHEIVFDLWPGLPLVMEIDCASEKDLNNGIKFLQLNKKNSFTKSKYDYLYGIPKNITQKLGSLNFKNYKKQINKHIKKNKSKFTKLNKKFYMNYLSKKNIEKYNYLF